MTLLEEHAETIASHLGTIAQSPWYEPLISPGAILLSGSIGFLAAHLIDKRQRQREAQREQNRAALVEHTLRDEITRRWRKRLGFHLERSIAREFSFDNAGSFCRFRLSDSDLFVIKTVAEDFPNHHQLSFPFVSQVVHAHLLLRDFIDNKETLNDLYFEYESHIRTIGSSDDNGDEASAVAHAQEQFRESATARWNKLQEKYLELNHRLERLLQDLEKSGSRK